MRSEYCRDEECRDHQASLEAQVVRLDTERFAYRELLDELVSMLDSWSLRESGSAACTAATIATWAKGRIESVEEVVTP